MTIINRTKPEPTITTRIRKNTMRRLKILAAYADSSIIDYLDKISKELMQEHEDLTKPVSSK